MQQYGQKPYCVLFFEILQYIAIVTGYAKTWHNRTSLNFQYKALNGMGEILAYFKKYYGIFLNAWFVEKETSNNKNLDIIWFAYSRGVRKSFSRPKDTPVMGVCLRHVETILCDRFFLIDFAFVCSEERWYTNNLPSNRFPYSWQTRWCKL